MEAGAVPTAEELQQTQQVGEAAAGAIQDSIVAGKGKDDARERANAAVESKARSVGLQLSKEDVHAIVDEMIDRMDALGVFREPPVAPSASTPPAPTPEAQAAADAAAEQAIAEVAPPEKKSFADRFCGN